MPQIPAQKIRKEVVSSLERQQTDEYDRSSIASMGHRNSEVARMSHQAFSNHGEDQFDRRASAKTQEPELVTHKWNRVYLEQMSDSGPQGLKGNNRGTTYLVAPLPLSTNPKMQKNYKKQKEFLYGRNKEYIQINDPERSINGDDMLESPRVNESPKIVKKTKELKNTEKLQKMLQANQKADGVNNVVNNRSLPAPHNRFKKAFGRTNNFATGKTSKGSLGDSKPVFGDEEIFDKDAAKFALGSPTSKTSLNPLFQNTK